MNFKTFSPDTEIQGISMLNAIETLKQFNIPIADYLEQHGLTDIDGEGWYKEQLWLDILNKIYTKFGPNTIFTLGKGVGAKVPAFDLDFRSLLNSLGPVYNRYHRNTTTEYFVVENYDEQNKKATMAKHNPYPVEYSKGLLIGMMRKFKPNPYSLPVVDVEVNQAKNICHLHLSW